MLSARHPTNRRYLVAVVLFALVALVIVVARLLPHSGPGPTSLIDDGTPPIIDAGASLATGAPGVSPSPAGPLLHAPVRPVTKKGAATPQVVAKQFGTAWAHHDGVTATAWLSALTPYATAALATRLAQTDPSNVPASRVTGPVTITDDTADACGASVPTDTGTLLLGLQRVNDVWLVATVDWDRA